MIYTIKMIKKAQVLTNELESIYKRNNVILYTKFT